MDRHTEVRHRGEIPPSRKIEKTLDRLVTLVRLDVVINIGVLILAVFPALEALGVLRPR
jgi:hypothetical protein